MLQTAIAAAKQAGDILEKYFSEDYAIEFKDHVGKDTVTIADREAEARIKKTILQKFPHHGFWGEETGTERIDQEYLWIVDPLDGTTNFSRHIPLYATSIALLYRGEAIMGVINIPKTKELFVAEKNTGSYCNEKKIKVSAVSELAQAVCSVEYWSRDDAHRAAGLKDFAYFAEHAKKIRYLSSTAFTLCRVACGDVDFCLSDTTFIDIAAAQLIIKEAGGYCERKDGAILNLDSVTQPHRIIASNKNLHNHLANYCSQ